MNKDKKNLEVVTGDGSTLNISPVYDHISAEKHKMNDKKPKNIIIPKIKNNDKKNKEED